MKFIFCMQINIKISYKLISTLWVSKFADDAIIIERHNQAYSKVLKVTSLHYLYNISKKKLGMEFILCMQINVKVSTSWLYRFLMEVARYVRSTQNRKLVLFFQYIKKKYRNCFCILYFRYSDTQIINIQIFK